MCLSLFVFYYSVFFFGSTSPPIQMYDRPVIHQAQNYYQHYAWFCEKLDGQRGIKCHCVQRYCHCTSLTHERTAHVNVWLENNNRDIQHRIMKFWVSIAISKYFSLTVQPPFNGCCCGLFAWGFSGATIKPAAYIRLVPKYHLHLYTLLNFLMHVSVHFKLTALYHYRGNSHMFRPSPEVIFREYISQSVLPMKPHLSKSQDLQSQIWLEEMMFGRKRHNCIMDIFYLQHCLYV